MDRLLAYDAIDDAALEARISNAKLNLYNTNDLQRWWLLRMAYTQPTCSSISWRIHISKQK